MGSALVWHLNNLGLKNIIIADVLGKDDKWKNLVGLKYEDYYEADDLLTWLEQDENLLTRMNVKFVFHMGAGTAAAEKDASYLVENNFSYTKVLAEAALNAKARFVYASAAATYGAAGRCAKDPDSGLEELRPLSMYGYSKHMFDLWAQKHNILGDMIGLKYFNVFGPNEYHKDEMRSLIFKAADQIIKTGMVDLYKSYDPRFSDGLQRRDFLYVKDAAKMTVFLATAPSAGGIYDIGSGASSSWSDFVLPVFRALGKPEKLNYIDMPESLREKYQYDTCANLEKLRKAGYKEAVTPLADAVTDYMQNYIIPKSYLAS